jgi:DNA-binding NarL/FixJ family response regulator
MRIATVGFSEDLKAMLKDLSGEILGEFEMEETFVELAASSLGELSSTNQDIVILYEPDLDHLSSAARLLPVSKWILIVDRHRDRNWNSLFTLPLNGLLFLPLQEHSLKQSLIAAREGSFFSEIPISALRGIPEARNPQVEGVLTPREWHVLDLLRTGKSFKEVADQLHLSAETVNNHMRHVRAKLGVQSSIQAIHAAYMSPIEAPRTDDVSGDSKLKDNANH